MLGSGNWYDAIKDIADHMTIGGKGTVDMVVNMRELTGGLLPAFDSGDMMGINVLISSQRVGSDNPSATVFPGIYMYTSRYTPVVSNFLRYVMANFGKAIRAIPKSKYFPGGSVIADALEESALALALDAAGGDMAFGWFLKFGVSMGWILTMPLLGGNLPGTDFLVGSVSLSCNIKFPNVEVTCGLGYEEPQWVAMFWDGTELVADAENEKGTETTEHYEWFTDVVTDTTNTYNWLSTGPSKSPDNARANARKNLNPAVVNNQVTRSILNADLSPEGIKQWAVSTGDSPVLAEVSEQYDNTIKTVESVWKHRWTGVSHTQRYFFNCLQSERSREREYEEWGKTCRNSQGEFVKCECDIVLPKISWSKVPKPSFLPKPSDMLPPNDVLPKPNDVLPPKPSLPT